MAPKAPKSRIGPEITAKGMGKNRKREIYNGAKIALTFLFFAGTMGFIDKSVAVLRLSVSEVVSKF
ncbi:MAG: hypothetical protein JO269_02360 [Burkholderiaceae bacterium]|nr:hypothetical protein [Burkholderiaceae bacterium]